MKRDERLDSPMNGLATSCRVALLAGFLTSAALSGQECSWLSASALDQAFPDNAPWQVEVGGEAGSCKFSGLGGHQPAMFGAHQMLKASVREAEETAETLAAAMAESYDVEAASGLGRHGFWYAPRDQAGSGSRLLFFVGHRGAVVVTGSLNLHGAITLERKDRADELIAAALAIADDPVALETASNCSFFDAELVEKVLPGEGFEQQMFGESSCMARAGDDVLLYAVVEGATPSVVETMTDLETTSCESEAVPSLGTQGVVTYACSAGRPRVVVRFLSGSRMVSLSLAAAREPSAEIRSLLVKIAEGSIDR